MNLKKETIDNINKYLLFTIGINYEEFKELDSYVQQEIIRKYHKKNNNKRKDSSLMVGSGEHAIFITVKKGKHIMIDGEVMVETGLTLDDSKQKSEDRYDDQMYIKPVSIVKKIV